jgi:hypothetical protein
VRTCTGNYYDANHVPPFHLPPEDYALLKGLPFEEISQTVLPYCLRRTAEFCPPISLWAPIRGAVSFDSMWTSDGELEDHAQILEASCALASANPMGSVSDGHIVLKAPLAPPSAWASTKRMLRIFFKDVASASLCAARTLTTSTSTPKAALSGTGMSGLRWICLKKWRLLPLWIDNLSGGSVS